MSETHTNCTRCGRKLTSPTSITRGYGKGCAAKIRRTTVEGFKPDQIDAARELIEDGGIIQIRPRIYRTVSTDGTEYHLTATTGHCTCKAGIRGTRCYHIAAALLLAA